jgi:hypothetical protein
MSQLSRLKYQRKPEVKEANRIKCKKYYYENKKYQYKYKKVDKEYMIEAKNLLDNNI